jgi:hypothetical protein
MNKRSRPASAACATGNVRFFSAGWNLSPADLVPEILDRVADFAAALAECILDFAFGLVGFAFVAKLLVIRQLARALFDLSFSAIDFAFDLVAIPHQVFLPGGLPRHWHTQAAGVVPSRVTAAVFNAVVEVDNSTLRRLRRATSSGFTGE